MKQRLLDFLACPDCCSYKLNLEIMKCSNGGLEIEEGSLDCSGCGRTFVIKAGIPRMLPHDLQSIQGNVFKRCNEGILSTISGYDFHHLRKGHNDSKKCATTTSHPSNLNLSRQYFYDYLDLNSGDTEAIKGRVLLDAGCGGGRFMAIAHEYAALDIVGLDFSEGGLLHARCLLKDREGFHLVQGDITRPPLRPETFDIIYCMGVLHLLKNPEEGFNALKSLIAKGGQLWVWVYGLESMSLIYRLSHLTLVRNLIRSWSLQNKFRLCEKLALVFWCLYLFPMTLAKKVLPASIISPLPFTGWTSYSYYDIVYAFFDRLQPPYTHYLRKAQLEEYFASLQEVEIHNPGKHGWVVKGKKLR